MKKIILVFVILVGGSAEAQHCSLEIKMTGFENSSGVVKVGVYDSEANFLQKVYKSAKVEIRGNAAVASFTDLPKGTYAVSVYHDQNKNDVLDRNAFGIPQEGYGTSNGATGFMGPPKFEDAKFNVTSHSIINITINN